MPEASAGRYGSAFGFLDSAAEDLDAALADARALLSLLEAMGVLTHGNVRVSLTRDTTDEEVEGFLAVLPEVVRDIRAEVGL